MCVGMEAVIGLMHTEHGMNLDFDKVNDVLSQGDRMWVGIGESYAENAAEEAMRAAVSMLLMKPVPVYKDCWDLYPAPARWILHNSPKSRAFRAAFGKTHSMPGE